MRKVDEIKRESITDIPEEISFEEKEAGGKPLLPGMKYYRLDNIKEKNAKYNVIYGERSNGKTYAVLEEGLKQYHEHKTKMAIIRRWEDDFKKKRGQNLFNGHAKNGLIKKYTDGEWTDVYFQSMMWYFCRYEEDERITAPEPFAYAFSLNSVEHDKSTSYPDVNIILFDEFLTRRMYLPDEFVIFMNVLSTIIRDRDDVTIYMCGNTVNMYSPYYNEMGLTNVKKQKKGTIDVYEYGDSGLRVAVEYSDSPSKKGKKSDVYFAFDNPKLKMITNGSWEMEIYPHRPVKFVPKDIAFTYFVEYDGELLQCEVVVKDKNFFTFVHRKTGEIKYPDKDLIFCPQYDPRPNWRRKITKPQDDLGKKIYNFYLIDKVFYQDNPTGEVMRNYINWCKKEGL